MWSALRHRRGQVIALALVSALVVTCAVFSPVFARSIDQALLRVHVTEADPAATATAIARNRTSTDRDLRPGGVAAAVPAQLAEVSRDPIQIMRHSGDVVPAPGKKPSPVVVRSRTSVCEHLEVAGDCPSAAGEVLVSAADAKAWGWKAGTKLAVPQGKWGRFDPDPPPVELRVVGTYTVVGDPDYWLGDRPDGKSGVTAPDLDNLPLIDDLITDEATFADAFPKATALVVLPLDREAATLDSLPLAAQAVEGMREEHPELDVDDTATTLMDGIATGRDQTAVIVPFVTVQLALLSVIVLFLVAQAAVDQRRHDVALARLRGRSRSGARRLLLAELLLPVLLGVPLGVVAALGLAVFVRRLMLPAGLPFEVPLAVLGWIAGALLLSVLAVHLAARPVLREPVNDLLRSVRPSTAGGSRTTEAVVVVLAVIGVVGLATGALSGPAALATPTLLAIAVGVLAARLVPALAARRARSAMRRGRVAAALAGHGIGRRPAARRVLTVTTVATAVAIFGANAVVVADRNREARADLETGAPAVLTVDSTTAPALLDAAQLLTDDGIAAAPVALIRPRARDAEATLATDPDLLSRVAHPDTVAGLDLSPLRLPEQAPIPIPGARATAHVSWDLTTSTGDADPALVVDMTTADGASRSATLATLGPKTSGSRTVRADLYCPEDCRLAGLRVATSGATGTEVTGTVTMTGLAVDGQELPVADAQTWASTRTGDGTGVTTKVTGDSLRLDVQAADGGDVSTWVTDVPRPMPAIASTPGPKGEVRQVVDVSGGQTEVRIADVPTQLPSVTDRGVLLSLPALARVTGDLDTVRTERQIWLADASPAAVDRATALLAEDDVTVRSVVTSAQAASVYDRSASGWGLQLALIGGGLAVSLAGLVLVILAVTGWRAAARDLAALRISGVSRAAVARATCTEHLTTVVVGVLLGAACAVAGSWIALPSIPLFTSPARVPRADLAPDWPTVLGATAGVTLVLVVIAWLLAGVVLRRVRLGAARGELG